ncbi:MAG: hypothetical protein HRU41_03420 [Saprospiraceae bacterium]|nr:hypothetical protein [Saprospiraceae bacterium]
MRIKKHLAGWFKLGRELEEGSLATPEDTVTTKAAATLIASLLTPICK